MIATLHRLLDLAGAPRRRLWPAVALGALTVSFGVGLMACAGYLISRAAEGPAILALMTVIVAVRFFGIARPLARYLERLTSHDLALRVLGRVRARVYERIEPLAPAQLREYTRGDLLSRMVADVDSLQNLHLRGVMPPLVALLSGALSVGVAAAFMPVAALVLAAGLLAGGVAVPALSGRLFRRAAARQARARARLSTELVELLDAAPELAVYGAGGAALGRVRSADRDLVGVARRDALSGGLADGLGLAVAGATVAGALALCVEATSAGQLDRVLIAMLALLALASFEAVQPLAAAARELDATVAAGRRVLELIEREPALTEPARPRPLPPAPFAIALEGVTARYAAGEPAALEQVSLRLEAGRRMALVGASGAGKSTVVNLLLRFLDPARGRVTLGGTDLRDYRQEDVRRAIAVVGQDSHLFSTSIRENVRLARPEATAAEVDDALRRARLWERVRALPEGADTLVGEQGRALSGGERQRVALARALLADAPVLVLDEPTAHLDPPTAERLMRDLLGAAGERAVLLITHRPEGLELVDEVVGLEGGRIAVPTRR